MSNSNDVDRIIGRLEEHKEQTNARLDRIESKIDSLQSVKWKFAGGAATISALVAFLVEYMRGDK